MAYALRIAQPAPSLSCIRSVNTGDVIGCIWPGAVRMPVDTRVKVNQVRGSGILRRVVSSLGWKWGDAQGDIVAPKRVEGDEHVSKITLLSWAVRIQSAGWTGTHSLVEMDETGT